MYRDLFRKFINVFRKMSIYYSYILIFLQNFDFENIHIEIIKTACIRNRFETFVVTDYLYENGKQQAFLALPII